jgi:histo-blood group ABO system transferase
MIKKVNIFSIATNNYHEFEKPFLDSFSSLFLPGVEKEFFLFTDNIDLPIYKEFKVNPIYIDHQPWPMITISRYDYLSKITPSLNEEDLCLFCDIDLEAVDKIEDFPSLKLFGVYHPGNLYVDNKESLEDNILSQAFVDKQNLPELFSYIQGCFWGGTGKHFNDLVQSLNKSVKIDFFNNVVAKWHDESHLNRYYLDHFKDFLILSPLLAWPENWPGQPNRQIIHKDKSMDKFPRFEGKS